MAYHLAVETHGPVLGSLLHSGRWVLHRVVLWPIRKLVGLFEIEEAGGVGSGQGSSSNNGSSSFGLILMLLFTFLFLLSTTGMVRIIT